LGVLRLLIPHFSAPLDYSSFLPYPRSPRLSCCRADRRHGARCAAAPPLSDTSLSRVPLCDYVRPYRRPTAAAWANKCLVSGHDDLNHCVTADAGAMSGAEADIRPVTKEAISRIRISSYARSPSLCGMGVVHRSMDTPFLFSKGREVLQERSMEETQAHTHFYQV
jgi:hypothetical protein